MKHMTSSLGLCPPLRSRGGGSSEARAGGVAHNGNSGLLAHDPRRFTAIPLLIQHQHLTRFLLTRRHLAGRSRLGRYLTAGGDQFWSGFCRLSRSA
jgi:hypothetical protein